MDVLCLIDCPTLLLINIPFHLIESGAINTPTRSHPRILGGNWATLLVHYDLLVFTSIFSLSILMRVQNRYWSCQYFRAETKEQSWEAAAITKPASEWKITKVCIAIFSLSKYSRSILAPIQSEISGEIPLYICLLSSDLWRLINGCQTL